LFDSEEEEDSCLSKDVVVVVSVSFVRAFTVTVDSVGDPVVDFVTNASTQEDPSTKNALM
jgi:hypothetical protein